MVSVTQKSRTRVSALPALTISLWPFLSLTVLATPLANTNVSKACTGSTAAVNPTTYSKVSIPNQHSPKPLLLSDQTSSRTSSRSAAAKAGYRLFDKEVSPGGLIHCQAIKHASSNGSSLLPRPCRCLTLALKAQGPHPGIKLLQCLLSRRTSKKGRFRIAKLTFNSSSNWLPKSTSRPQNASQQPSSPALTRPTALLPLTLTKTSPPALGKASPVPFPDPSAPPPEASSRPGPPPPPRRPPSTPPLFEHQPFIVSWNIPDLACNRLNVSLDTSAFKGVATPAKVKL